MQGRIYSKFLLRQKENHEKRQQTQVSSRQKQHRKPHNVHYQESKVEVGAKSIFGK